MIGLDPERSHSAMLAIQTKLPALDEDEKRRFVAKVRNLPTAIQINGLLAVIQEPEQVEMRDLLSAWLTGGQAPVAWTDSQPLSVRLQQASRQVYRQASLEALDYSVWLKRWVQVEVGDE